MNTSFGCHLTKIYALFGVNFVFLKFCWCKVLDLQKDWLLDSFKLFLPLNTRSIIIQCKKEVNSCSRSRVLGCWEKAGRKLAAKWLLENPDILKTEGRSKTQCRQFAKLQIMKKNFFLLYLSLFHKEYSHQRYAYNNHLQEISPSGKKFQRTKIKCRVPSVYS